MQASASGNYGEYGYAKDALVEGLKDVYMEKVLPLEKAFMFDAFYGPLLTESDFNAKPSVLLLGQYSTGKTTFIQHLLQREYPGAHIGPEPTTDRFVVVMGGEEERITPGNTLVVEADKPYADLAKFGTSFLNKLECTQCDSRLLDEVTLIDTPGVLSGQKQRIGRSYDFVEVCQWFAARSDVILLLFDPHKLDISDEFNQVISALRPYDDKVRVVLNKADQVDAQQLMRVYGALMWSLRKVFDKPEVPRVYVGSFNSAPFNRDRNEYGEKLFLREHEDLVDDLHSVPRRAANRKVNELVKRIRTARIHALLLSHLKKQMPRVLNKQKAQENLLLNLEDEFAKVRFEYRLPDADFPPIGEFREAVRYLDFSKFPELDKKSDDRIMDVLSRDIPELLKKYDLPFAGALVPLQ